MTGKGAGRASNRTYYQCSLRHHAGRDQCDFPLLDAKQVQEGVWNCLHEIFTSPAFVEQQLESLRARLAAEQPEADKRATVLVRRRDEVKAALGKYHRLFEASRDPVRDAALMDRVKELGAEQERIEKELADLQQHRVIRLPVRLTEERVRGYLGRLRERMDERPEHQKALFAEMQREHGLQVRPASKSEIVVSLALPMREVVEEPLAVAVGGSRVYSVLAGVPAGKRSDGPGSPEPGGPRKSRLCPPAAATSSARRGASRPRTSVRSCSTASAAPGTKRARGRLHSPRRKPTTSGSVEAA